MKISTDIGLKVRKKIETDTALFVLYEEDIMLVVYKDLSFEFELEMARAHTRTIKQLHGPNCCHLILDFSHAQVAFSNEAREYFAKDSEHAALRRSQAVVVRSLANKIVANFYLKFNKPTCPVAIFDSIPAAVEWSLQLSRQKTNNSK